MRYTHVLLDLDHTLLDTDTSLELAFVDAMVVADADPTGRYSIFDEINQTMWRQVEAQELTPPQVHIARFEQLNEQLGLGADPQQMADAFALGMGAHGGLYDGARQMLDQLSQLTTLGMVTNGLSDIQRARVERLELGHYFDAIIVSAEVGCAKPGTEIFDITFAALDEPDRDKTLMVGDNPGSDIAGGNNAGIDTCWYNPASTAATGEVSATHTISMLSELIGLVY